MDHPKREVEHLFHYLDDYITVGPPATSVCLNNLAIIKQACHDTGTPIEESKSVGPATTITFLGMELDSVSMEIRLPQDKLRSLRMLLEDWKSREEARFALVDWCFTACFQGC